VADAAWDALPDFCRKDALVLGCGNILFGDDGFGCAVVGHLERKTRVPSHVCLLDAGTGARKILFTLALSPVVPRRLLVVDAVDAGRTAGEIFEIRLSEIPPVKRSDFSMHQIPTSNLLQELAEHRGIEVRVLVCQTGPLPEIVRPGLSDAVAGAVPGAAAWISSEYFAVTSGGRSGLPSRS